MKESVGYTVTLNIAITFIIIVFAFLSAAIIYFKSNKVSNIIMNSIEKYEGYNKLAVDDIKRKMDSLGYSSRNVKCSSFIDTKKEACFLQVSTNSSDSNMAQLATFTNLIILGSSINSIDSTINSYTTISTSDYGADGYCVYLCFDRTKNYDTTKGFDIYYKVRTNMMMNVPIINSILDIPIYSNTNTMHVFKENFE